MIVSVFEIEQTEKNKNLILSGKRKTPFASSSSCPAESAITVLIHPIIANNSSF